MASRLISFGDVQVGESRIKLKLSDFKIKVRQKKKIVRTKFIKDSLQWIRDDSNNLLVPRVRVLVYINKKSSQLSVNYIDKTYVPQEKKSAAAIDLWVNLFNTQDIKVLEKGKVIATVQVHAVKDKARHSSHLIDYSCDPYGLVFEGLEHEYMSVGCRLEKPGSWNKRRPRLVVTWMTSNFRLPGNKAGAYHIVFHEKSKARIKLYDRNGREKTVTLKLAFLPRKIRRLKTALGFGPYQFDTIEGDLKNHQLAPAFMIYGRYDLINNASLRFFNATVKNQSLFNNGGLYFSYELASVFDNRIELNPLLGAQILTYQYDSDRPTQNSVIYPQGIEVVWKHSFNIKNFTTVYGMFLSSSDTEPYVNMWLRWGKKYFWELNYIKWSNATSEMQTYGLSVGIPFLSFF